MRIVILTGDELRHQYFRKKVAINKNISVLATFCEGDEHSLLNRVSNNANSSQLEKQHVNARMQSEKDYFSDLVEVMADFSNPIKIKKGDINLAENVERIIELEPELLVCYGSSLIKSTLLEEFRGRFLNAHLGLSPYYRGSGTNVWPLINNEPEMVGVTFMHIDEGIDTGNIIHQIRADIFLGDTPHTIGNRLIKQMTDVYCDLIVNFNALTQEEKIHAEGRLYLQKDFDDTACQRLYGNFNKGLISDFLNQNKPLPQIVCNSLFNKI